jgi:DNA polymerase-3 subunit delta'
MPGLASLLDQPRAQAFLRGVLRRRRFVNAYLFAGPWGVGKGTAALAFARAVNCERQGEDACDECASCRKALHLQHPDLRFLFPVSGEEKDLEDTVAETLAAMREDPLHVFSYEKAASIRLSLTRELLRELAYAPFESGYRVIVIRDADRMREDQYSAILKSLEEPGAQTLWVLTTSRPHRLPATIHSRCQTVRFGPLREETIERFLLEKAGVRAKDARVLAALASGSLARALTLRDEAALELRDQALALLEPALRRDYAGLWKASQSAAGFGRANREKVRRTVEFQLLWLRDLLRMRYGAGPEGLVNRDLEPQLRAIAARVTAGEVRRRVFILEETLRAIEGNVSPDLAFFSGLARVAGDALAPPGDWPLAATARWDY